MQDPNVVESLVVHTPLLIDMDDTPPSDSMHLQIANIHDSLSVPLLILKLGIKDDSDWSEFVDR